MKDIVIPVTALCKGVNVLAIEIHLAPLSPVYSINAQRRVGLWTQIAFLKLSLTAPQGVSVISGGTPPKQIRLFNASPSISLHNLDSFDQWESLRPIELITCKNASASGQIVLCSPTAIRGVTVSVSALERKVGEAVTSIPISAI